MGKRSGLTLEEFADSLPRGVRRVASPARPHPLVPGEETTAAGARPRRAGAARLPRRARARRDRHRGAPRRLPQGRADGAARLALGAVEVAARVRELRLLRAVRARRPRRPPRSRRTTRRPSAPGTDPISQPTGPLARIPRVACRTGGRRSGAVAQLVAHLHGMQRVRGSSPLSSTGSPREPQGSSTPPLGQLHRKSAGTPGFEYPTARAAPPEVRGNPRVRVPHRSGSSTGDSEILALSRARNL